MADSEKPDEIAREAARGRSARTPGLAIGGVLVTVGIAVLAVTLVVALVYLVS
jgi:hypothetical protein